MKPGERIPLIKAATDSLLGQFDDATLILTQFGIDVDGWGWNSNIDSKRQFLTTVIAQSDDEVLASLHDYLVGGEQAPVSTTEDEELWGDQPLRIFISHKWEDAEWVSGVRDVLAKYGISAFVAHKDITPSKRWRDVIKSGLRSCHMMVAVLHEDFHTSQWCDQEVGWALGRGIPIATVRRGDAFKRENDGFLEEVQDIVLDLTKSSGEWRAAREIFRAAIRSVKPPELVRRTIAEALVTSASFENSRNLWAPILRQEQWEPQSLDRIKYAVQTNRQVYEANVDGVPMPALVNQLVEKFDPTPVFTEDDVPF